MGGAVRATGLPVLADGEAGFGSVLSVQRLVWEMENVGAAGLHLEDQDVPRRCGHYEGKRLVSTATHVGRLRGGDRHPARSRLPDHRPHRCDRRDRL